VAGTTATLTVSQHVVIADTNTAGAVITLTLPAISADTNGLIYHIKSKADGTNNVIVNTTGSDTIDGLTTLTPALLAGESRMVIADDSTKDWGLV
jgi:hypothetical protein